MTEPASDAGPAAARPPLDIEDLYDHAPCGYVTTLPDGLIVDVNQTFLEWTGQRREDIVGAKRFADLLPRGARISHVTHHLPALEQAGELREVASEILCTDGRRLAVTLSSTMRHSADGAVELIRTTVTDATARWRYERELRTARDQERLAREQAEQLVDELERRGREQTALGKLGRLALSDADVDGLLAKAAKATRQGLLVEDVRVLLPDDPDAGETVVAAGDATIPIGDPDEPFRVIRVRTGGPALRAEDLDFVETIANVAWLAIERRRSDERHRYLALHDSLTGLPNRSLVFDRLASALARARRSGSRLGVLVLDLDGFKAINDSLGHHAGDEVLKVVARRLDATVRESDTVGRLGGDEFAILCEDVAGEPQVAELVARLTAAVAKPIPLEGTDGRLTASIGMVLSDGATDPDTILREADHAMYAVKTGRDAGR